MKLFFLGDIHGNHIALKSILEYAKEINSDMIFCLGDISGYLLGINEVIGLLKEYNVKTILGNHDAMLLGYLPINENRPYYSTLIETKKKITKESFNWLKSLKATETHVVEKKRIKFYHGGPLNLYSQYVFPGEISSLTDKFTDAEIFVFGHSHLQFALNISNNLFINPGSVGLPRNGDNRAHGISYDLKLDKWNEHRICYDLCSAINLNLKSENFNTVFIHNILFGRSSNKKLKKINISLFYNDLLIKLKKLNLHIIISNFGIILNLQTSDDIIYIANYHDNTVELTTSTLYFNWKDSFNLNKDLNNFPEMQLTKDQAGSFIKKSYNSRSIFEKNILLDIENILNVINKRKWKNIIF